MQGQIGSCASSVLRRDSLNTTTEEGQTSTVVGELSLHSEICRGRRRFSMPTMLTHQNHKLVGQTQEFCLRCWTLLARLLSPHMDFTLALIFPIFDFHAECCEEANKLFQSWFHFLSLISCIKRQSNCMQCTILLFDIDFRQA